jgi:hypothetical protein
MHYPLDAPRCTILYAIMHKGLHAPPLPPRAQQQPPFSPMPPPSPRQYNAKPKDQLTAEECRTKDGVL